MRLFTILLLVANHALLGQSAASKPIRILFIGNSYIYYNAMPEMISKVAASYGEKVESDSQTPGGYTLKHQVSEGIALDKIKRGNWNFVVLQEQSEAPAGPIDEVKANTFPFARYLD